MELNLTSKEFCIVSILNHSDNSLNSKVRLKMLLYLSDKELGDKFSIYNYTKGNVGPEPNRMQQDINSLENKEIIIVNKSRTFGGKIKYSYEMHHSSTNLIHNIIKNNDSDIKELNNIIGNVCMEYSDIPISNLMNIVRQKYPKYFQNNTHLQY